MPVCQTAEARPLHLAITDGSVTITPAQLEAIRAHVLAAERIHADDTTMPVLAKGRTHTGRLWTYVRDDRPFDGSDPPATVFFYSRDRGGEHPERHLAGYAGLMQADALKKRCASSLAAVRARFRSRSGYFIRPINWARAFGALRLSSPRRNRSPPNSVSGSNSRSSAVQWTACANLDQNCGGVL